MGKFTSIAKGTNLENEKTNTILYNLIAEYKKKFFVKCKK